MTKGFSKVILGKDAITQAMQMYIDMHMNISHTVEKVCYNESNTEIFGCQVILKCEDKEIEL